MKRGEFLGMAIVLFGIAGAAHAQSLGDYDSRRALPRTASPTGQYTVEAKFIEVTSDHRQVTLASPTLTAQEGVTASLSMNGFKAIDLGGGVSLTAPSVTVSVPGDDRDEQLQLGRKFDVKVVTTGVDRVRVDLRVESSDLEAVEDGIRVHRTDTRAIEQVALGGLMKVVMSKHDDGTPKRWLELRVRTPGGPDIARSSQLPHPYNYVKPTPAAPRYESDERYNPSIGSRPASRR